MRHTSNKSSACLAMSSRFAPGRWTLVSFSPLNTPPPPATRRNNSCRLSFWGVRHSRPITWTYNQCLFSYLSELKSVFQQNTETGLTCGGHFLVRWSKTVCLITSKRDLRYRGKEKRIHLKKNADFRTMSTNWIITQPTIGIPTYCPYQSSSSYGIGIFLILDNRCTVAT